MAVVDYFALGLMLSCSRAGLDDTVLSVSLVTPLISHVLSYLFNGQQRFNKSQRSCSVVRQRCAITALVELLWRLRRRFPSGEKYGG